MFVTYICNLYYAKYNCYAVHNTIINRYVHRRLSAPPLPADGGLFYKQRAKYGNQIHHNSAALTGVTVKCFFIPTGFE
jgi:hypothetical protein